MKKTYRLYAMPYNAETVGAAEKERFSRVAADYVLIYTAKRVKNAVQVTEAEAHRLSGSERQWLFDCNTALLAEETKRHSGEILQNLSEKLDKLESALAAQKEIEERRNGADG